MIHARLLGLTITALAAFGTAAAPRGHAPACDPGNGGIDLPSGFCATVFADSLPSPRHMYVMPNGDVFVSLIGKRGGGAGGVILLRDKDHDGRSDSQSDFVRGFRSSEVSVFDGHLYTEDGTNILRYPLKNGRLLPAGPVDTIVAGLPPGGNHPFKTFAIGRDGSLYVNIGSADNLCDQGAADAKHPPDPCAQLATRAGIWRFDARKKDQHQADGVHFASGFRNAAGEM